MPGNQRGCHQNRLLMNHGDKKPCSSPKGTFQARRASATDLFPNISTLVREEAWLEKWCFSQAGIVRLWNSSWILLWSWALASFLSLQTSFCGKKSTANSRVTWRQLAQNQPHPPLTPDSTLTRCCRMWTEAQFYTSLYGRHRCLVAASTIYLLLLAEKMIMVTWKWNFVLLGTKWKAFYLPQWRDQGTQLLDKWYTTT